MPIYDYEYNGKIYSVQSDTQPNDDEVMSFIQSYKEPAPKPQPQKKVASQPSLPPVQETGSQPAQTETPTFLTGNVSKNAQYEEEHPIREAVRQTGRNVARALLPEKLENWFIGSKEEENFLKEYGNKKVKNYDQLTYEFNNGLISKDEYINGINLRNKLDSAIADDEYRQERNKNIGKGAVDIGTGFIPVGGGAKIAAKGAQLLKPAVGKTLAKAISQGAVGGAIGGAAMGLGEGLIDRDMNPLTSALLYSAIGAPIGATGGAVVGKIANAVRARELAKRKAIPLYERMSERALDEVTAPPSNYGVSDTNSATNKEIGEQIDNRVQAELNVLDKYKKLHADLNKKYGSIEKLKKQAAKDNKENAKYGATTDAMRDYGNLIASENDLLKTNYINYSFKSTSTGSKMVKDNALQKSVKGRKTKANKQPKETTETTETTTTEEIPVSEKQPIVQEQPKVYPSEKSLPGERVIRTSRLGQSDYVVDTLGRKVKVDYDTLPNAELIDMAEREVAKDPVGVLTDLLSRGADEKTNFSGLDIEKARQLLPKLYNEGRVDDAVNLTEVLSRKGTKAGQAVQAMSLWSKTTPEGAELYAQRVIDKYNDKHPKKPITLSPEQRAKIRELAANIQKFEEGTYERNRATAIMLKEIAQTVPTSAADKFRTLRNISLLLNPKTFARNISGNATLGGVENVITKPLAAGLDKIASLATGKRSRVATQGADYVTGLIEGFKRGNKEVLEGINTRNIGARFDLPNTRVFKAPVLKQLEVATDWSLRVPDSAFYQATFEESLRNQIKTAMINKGVKPTKITPEIMKEYMNSKMVKQATEEALESVFQNNGILSNGLTGIRRLLRGNGDFGIGDVLIPYAQTPANVAEMGLNYSPLGLLKGVGNLAKGNQRQATLDLARGLIGTGIGGVGYGLAKEGLAYAEGGKPQEKLNAELLGQKPYTMRIGDNYYSYNQIQPLGSPFAAGVAMGNKATPLESLDSYMGSILDTSMLRGINQLRTDVERYGPGVAGLNAVLGLPSQLIPTSLNQVNAYVDPIQRETYDPNPIQRTLNYAEAKIPGLSKTLPARYNLKGEEKKKYESEGIEKAFDVFLNPIFKSKAKDDLVARELIELNKSTGENVLLPIASKKITKKDNLKLSGKQYSEYQKVLGEKTYEGLNELINSNLYANADDNTRADLVQQRQKIIRAFVDEQLFGTENQYKPKAKDPVKKLENKVNNFNKKINKLKTMQILYDDLGIADVESILEEE